MNWIESSWKTNLKLKFWFLKKWKQNKKQKIVHKQQVIELKTEWWYEIIGMRCLEWC